MRTRARRLGILQVANFQDFLVDEIRHALARRRNGKTGFVAVECGQFLVILREEDPDAASAADRKDFCHAR